MTQLYDTTFCFKSLYYQSEEIKGGDENQSVYFTSSRKAKDVRCPCCGGRVIGHGQKTVRLKDIPLEPGYPITFVIRQHRYLCKNCKGTFLEENPFRVPGFNLTRRCILWIFQMLKLKISTSVIADFLGIHWNTVRKVEKLRLERELTRREKERLEDTYRPYYLAVDEFSIRKGHRYATCVMDLATGEVLWVGKGRTMKAFEAFFQAYSDTDYLSSVKAVAMDMNASYHALVEKYMPDAEIVYDRYHVQAQFGRDVLGQVRLEQAREHQKKAKELSGQEGSKEDRSVLQRKIQEEKKLYSKVKKARWLILTNKDKLSSPKEKALNEILAEHSDLALCYAMKEELIRLFDLRDPAEAEIGWKKWFDAAVNSPVPALSKFGRQKLARLDGLVAHAKHPINTGKLEGFNNKIKVAKRTAYGYRNLSYFFDYIKYLSIPKDFS